MIAPWAGKYVGIPFRDDGKDLNIGLNCYALLRAVFEREAGISLPDFDDISAKDIDRADIQFEFEMSVGPWRQISGPPMNVFDAMVMRGKPMHVGVAVSPNKILHVWRATHSVVMPIDHPRIRHRIVGIFRHRELDK